MSGRAFYLTPAGSRFTAVCGCLVSGENDGKPFLDPCHAHRPVVAAIEATDCGNCGWEWRHEREEYLLCQEHHAALTAATAAS